MRPLRAGKKRARLSEDSVPRSRGPRFFGAHGPLQRALSALTEEKMDFLDVVSTRRSIRSFISDPISRDEIELLCQAGCMAPSACNLQPWDFVVVTRRKTLDEIAERHPHAKFAKEAPLAIVVCGTPNPTTGEFWIQDCAAATQNILLAARNLGIASCWCGLHPVKERAEILRDIVKVPEGTIPLSLIILGRSEKRFSDAQRYKLDKVHYERW